jgi:toxin ParE1/3/4
MPALRLRGVIYASRYQITTRALRRSKTFLIRSGRIEGSRELVLTPLPYIAVYRIKGQMVEVSRIYHGAQDWP